jgi:hypothetical protein
MQFITQWFPLIVTVREGGVDSLELDELSAGFERYFARAEQYATLSTSRLNAPTPDAMARLRLAEWANSPRVRSRSKDLCAGSATVVARAWERHALTALQWLWTPAMPHEAVSSVHEGIAYCVDRLLARKLKLPAPAEVFCQDVQRSLAGLRLAGHDDQLERRDAPAAASAARLEKLADDEGCIVLGWLAPGVLWTSLTGRVNDAICQAYATRLDQLLRAASAVRYFVDSSCLESIELSARSTMLRTLIAQEPHFERVVVSNWSGGLSPATRSTLQALGSTIVVLQDTRDFGARLLRAAPQAREVIAAGAEELTPSPSLSR